MSEETKPSPPVVCFIGPSGVGKTTVVARVIEQLSRSGLRIGALKHSSHGFQMDREGKDTHRFRQAGAYAVGIASETERAVITTTDRPTSLTDLVAALPGGLDLIVVEGYKAEGAPKIEMQRRGAELMSRSTRMENLIAVVTDEPGSPDRDDPTDPLAGMPEHVAIFGCDDVAGICGFLRTRLLSNS